MQATSIENEFLSPEFNGETTSLPFAQIVNEKRKSDCGFFVTVDNLMAADWLLPAEQEYHTATWGNGEESEGLIIQNPRLLILAQSPLFMVERGTGLNLGVYDASFYRRLKSEVVLKAKYLIYFVDEQNQLRHNMPMQISLKGAAGASFGEHARKFRLELEKSFAVAHRQPVRSKNARFHAMGVLCIQTEPQQRGEEQKAWVCTTISHEAPTQSNWLKYFVGFTPLKSRLWADIDAHAEFGQIKAVEGIESATSGRALPSRGEEHSLIDYKEEMAMLPPSAASVKREEEARASLFTEVATATPVSVNQQGPGVSNYESEKESSLSPDIPF